MALFENGTLHPTSITLVVCFLCNKTQNGYSNIQFNYTVLNWLYFVKMLYFWRQTLTFSTIHLIIKFLISSLFELSSIWKITFYFNLEEFQFWILLYFVVDVFFYGIDLIRVYMLHSYNKMQYTVHIFANFKCIVILFYLFNS